MNQNLIEPILQSLTNDEILFINKHTQKLLVEIEIASIENEFEFKQMQLRQTQEFLDSLTTDQLIEVVDYANKIIDERADVLAGDEESE